MAVTSSPWQIFGLESLFTQIQSNLFLCWTQCGSRALSHGDSLRWLKLNHKTNIGLYISELDSFMLFMWGYSRLSLLMITLLMKNNKHIFSVFFFFIPSLLATAVRTIHQTSKLCRRDDSGFESCWIISLIRCFQVSVTEEALED